MTGDDIAMKSFLRIRDIAEELGVGPRTIIEYRSKGKLTLPMERIDGMLGCRREVFLNWLETGGRVA